MTEIHGNSENLAALLHLKHLTAGPPPDEAVEIIDGELSQPHSAEYTPHFIFHKSIILWQSEKRLELASEI